MPQKNKLLKITETFTKIYTKHFHFQSQS